MVSMAFEPRLVCGGARGETQEDHGVQSAPWITELNRPIEENLKGSPPIPIQYVPSV